LLVRERIILKEKGAKWTGCYVKVKAGSMLIPPASIIRQVIAFGKFIIFAAG